MSYLLTIGIAAYNRPNELLRCLNSITTKYTNKIEIIVSEDKSPKEKEIAKVVDSYKVRSDYSVRYNTNKNNLGYDRNLKKLISLSDAKYICFMSDDDMFNQNSMDELIELLDSKKEYGVVYSPFVLSDTNEKTRFYNECYEFTSSEKYASKHIYDSILFSGLIFNVSKVKNIDAERFLNKNYFQVYLFLTSVYKYGGYYLSKPLILCVGDGENGYGKSDSAVKNPLLMDRKSVFSNLEFHKGLISVIRMFDDDNNTHIFKTFEHEYNIRTISGLTAARKIGKNVLKEFWKKMNSLDIKINGLSHFYFLMLLILGDKITTNLLGLPRKVYGKLKGKR